MRCREVSSPAQNSRKRYLFSRRGTLMTCDSSAADDKLKAFTGGLVAICLHNQSREFSAIDARLRQDPQFAQI